MFNPFSKGARCAALAVFAFFSQSVLALGLGNAKVDSYLNQPLKARIDLIVRETDDLGSVTAGLASAEDFALIGANREALSVPLRFAIEQTGDGAVIVVSSNLPVRDPVIRLIVEVNWASGRMLREYTLFLDPPTFTAPAPSPVIDERGKPVSVTPPQQIQEQAGEPPAPSAAPEGEPEKTGGDEYGPVQGGETLWRIASNWSSGTGLDINTVMIAIQRNNPHAFMNDNISLLKRGAILRMPLISEVEEISVPDARREVRRQVEAYNQAETATAAETPLVVESPESPEESVEPAGESLDQQAVADGGSKDQAEDLLELVPPSSAADAGSSNGLEESPEEAGASTAVETLREELARKEEALIVEQEQNQYLQDRIAELESQLQAGGEGNVANADLAELEGKLREERLSKGQPEPAGQPSGTEAASAPLPPRATAAGPGNENEPWYTRLTVWVVGLLVLGAALAGWLLSRRSPAAVVVPAAAVRAGGSVREIKSEAESILKVLEPGPGMPATEGAVERPKAGDVVLASGQSTRPGHVEDASVLDEDSADPEVRLDLARAYIAMGDKEAARVILAEVIEHGNARQQNEAKGMLGEL